MRTKVISPLELIEKRLPQDDPLQPKPVIDLSQSELGWQPTVTLGHWLRSHDRLAYFKEALS